MSRQGRDRSQPSWAACLVALNVVVLGVVIVLAFLLHTPSPARVPRVQLGPFAGYVWDSEAGVHSISASWIVPRIARHSRPGQAATWIGAEAPGSASGAPFIQIGTNEESAADGRGLYYAFWSDTDRGFHPVFLWRARPGDRIAARMSLADGHWRLVIRDRRARQVASFTTTDESHAAFNEAQWLQEDPTDAGTVPASQFPYPQLTSVRFTKLTVNGAPPAAANLSSQWMSPARRPYIAPSALWHDGFSLRSATLSPLAAQYLSIVGPVNSVYEIFDHQLDGWASGPARPDQAEISGAFTLMGTALRHGVARVAKADWPPAVRRLVHTLILAWDEQITQLGVPPRPGAIRQWRHAWLQTPSPAWIGDAIRDALGAPAP